MKTLMLLLTLSITACASDPVSIQAAGISKPATSTCSGTLHRKVVASSVGQCSLETSPNASSLASTAP